MSWTKQDVGSQPPLTPNSYCPEFKVIKNGAVGYVYLSYWEKKCFFYVQGTDIIRHYRQVGIAMYSNGNITGPATEPLPTTLPNLTHHLIDFWCY